MSQLFYAQKRAPNFKFDQRRECVCDSCIAYDKAFLNGHIMSHGFCVRNLTILLIRCVRRSTFDYIFSAFAGAP